MLDLDAGGITDILDDLAPGFRALVVASGHLDQLNPLYSRRGDYALQAMANKLVGISRFRCGGGCLDHASLLANTVCAYSIGDGHYWQGVTG